MNRSRADALLRRLEVQGVRLTGQRELVVRAIAEQEGVASPEALVYALHPQGVGRATVYRTLELLEQQGVITRMHLDGRHSYALCDEGHHHHLVCTSCNAVLDVDAEDVEAAIQHLADRLKFRVDTHTLEFAGRCEACQSAD